MEIIDLHTPATPQQVFEFLNDRLNPTFQQQRQTDMSFKIEYTGSFIEVHQPQYYEGFLFRIEPKGNLVHITRSEHYVDDVNSLTLESVLHTLFGEFSGDKGNSLVQQG